MPGQINTTPLTYRPDIDGLRALAVLSVVLFHASDHVLPGGFVGVDIFFVISGYLISGIVFSGLSKGSFSFLDFYRKRALRIFPALITVLLFTAVLGNFALFPKEFSELGKHIAGGAAFVANLVYWSESGYFDRVAETKPLLHLWSLGVEEQFYLVWPLVLALLWRTRLSRMVVLVGLAIISFAINLIWLGSSAESAFYFPGSRFWELILGAILALLQFNQVLLLDGQSKFSLFGNINAALNGRLRDVAAVAGFLMIVGCCIALNRTVPYPGAWALLPVFGAVLLIGAGPHAWINRRILCQPGLVFIGLISYPLYLWHWPLLSFSRIVESGKPPGGLRIILMLSAVFLAYLTYRWIERPFRFGKFRFRASILWGAMVCMACFGLYAYTLGKFGIHDHPALEGQERIESPRNDPACKAKYPVLGAYCLETGGAGTVTTAIIGDSHAHHFMPGLEEALQGRGERAVHLGQPGCPILFGGVREKSGTKEVCAEVSDSILNFLATSSELTRVIISFRGPLNTTGHGYGEVEKNLFVKFSDATNPSLSAPAAMEATLSRTVQFLLAKGKEVWVFEEVPELGFHIDQCQVRPLSLTHKKRESCDLPRVAVDERQREYHRIVLQVKEKYPWLLVYDPKPSLCDDERCVGMKDNKALYADGDHLSRQGSLVAMDRFKPAFRQPN